MITYDEIDNIANEINKKHNINIFEDTNQHRVVNIRYFIVYYLKKKYKMKTRDIVDYLNIKGLKRSAETCEYGSRTIKKKIHKHPYLLELYNNYIRKNSSNRVVYEKINDKEENKIDFILNVLNKSLHLFPDNLTEKQENEIIECIKLKIQSFKWKDQL